MIYHLYDTTLGSRRRAACGSGNSDLKLGDDFAKLPSDQQCPMCKTEFEQSQEYICACGVCGQKFPDQSTRAAHDEEHVLHVASYRKDPVAFVVNTQSHYNDSDAKARTLAKAKTELRTYFPTFEFEIVPSRLMLTKDGENSVLLGEAHIADYIIVQK